MATMPISKAELHEELQGLRSEIRSEIRHYATKEDLANLRADMANLKVDLLNTLTTHLRWMIALQILSLGVIATVVSLL